MNWLHTGVFENNPQFLEKLGRMTKEVGVKPEIEVFDPGMIYNAQYYIKKGILDTPAHFQFCMGCAGGISATTKNLVFMKGVMDEVAPDSTWSAFGVGAGAMEILYAAIAMGGAISAWVWKTMFSTRRASLPKAIWYLLPAPDALLRNSAARSPLLRKRAKSWG
jgi:hypothetical protein